MVRVSGVHSKIQNVLKNKDTPNSTDFGTRLTCSFIVLFSQRICLILHVNGYEKFVPNFAHMLTWVYTYILQQFAFGKYGEKKLRTICIPKFMT